MSIYNSTVIGQDCSYLRIICHN